MGKSTKKAASKSKQVVTNQELPGLEALPMVPRQRGKGELVALTVRLPRADWQRVHQLAVAEGVSIQALAIEGLSKVFVEKGFRGLG